jgi:hypothetical protein
MKRARRGSILVLVMAVLAMLGILGATLSHVALRRLSAARAVERGEHAAACRRGGETSVCHATIGDGAEGASSNE